MQELSGNRPMADGRWFKCLAITLATGPLGALTLVGGSEIRRGRRNWRMHVQVSDRVATCKEEWGTTTPFFHLAGEFSGQRPGAEGRGTRGHDQTKRRQPARQRHVLSKEGIVYESMMKNLEFGTTVAPWALLGRAPAFSPGSLAPGRYLWGPRGPIWSQDYLLGPATVESPSAY